MYNTFIRHRDILIKAYLSMYSVAISETPVWLRKVRFKLDKIQGKIHNILKIYIYKVYHIQN